jgi:hypothetical protein
MKDIWPDSLWAALSHIQQSIIFVTLSLGPELSPNLRIGYVSSYRQMEEREECSGCGLRKRKWYRKEIQWKQSYLRYEGLTPGFHYKAVVFAHIENKLVCYREVKVGHQIIKDNIWEVKVNTYSETIWKKMKYEYSYSIHLEFFKRLTLFLFLKLFTSKPLK